MDFKKMSFAFVFLSLTSLVSADVGDGVGCFGPGMMSGSYGYSGMFFGWIFGILFIIILILLIVWLVKQINKK